MGCQAKLMGLNSAPGTAGPTRPPCQELRWSFSRRGKPSQGELSLQGRPFGATPMCAGNSPSVSCSAPSTEGGLPEKAVCSASWFSNKQRSADQPALSGVVLGLLRRAMAGSSWSGMCSGRLALELAVCLRDLWDSNFTQILSTCLVHI